MDGASRVGTYAHGEEQVISLADGELSGARDADERGEDHEEGVALAQLEPSTGSTRGRRCAHSTGTEYWKYKRKALRSLNRN